MSSKLIPIPANLNTTAASVNSQFKHTIFWNNIIENLKATLVETHNNSTRLRKQHSRFVAASVGGMLLIKQNLTMSHHNTSILNSESSSSYSSAKMNRASSSNNIYFTGSQCVDIVYSYLTSNHEALHLERQVTREKVVKLCQMIMESGAFEPANRTSTRFDDTSLKYYKIKKSNESDDVANRASKCLEESSPLKAVSGHQHRYASKVNSNEKENIVNASYNKNRGSSLNRVSDEREETESHSKEHEKRLTNSEKSESTACSSPSQTTGSNNVLFNKAKLVNKTSNVNTKLKRKLTSMRRSSTIQSLLPTDESSPKPPPTTAAQTTKLLSDATNKSRQSAGITIMTPIAYLREDMDLREKKTVVANRPTEEKGESNFFSALSNEALTSPIKKMFVKDKTNISTNVCTTASSTSNKQTDKSGDNVVQSLALKFENKPTSYKLAQELLSTRQITRELIIEKLLSLIDLPIIEHLLLIDERNDIEYCEALQKFDTLLTSSNLNQNKAILKSNNDSTTNLTGNANQADSENNKKASSTSETTASTSKNTKHELNVNQINKLLSKSSLNLIQRSLAILEQAYDFSKCEADGEWRKSALDCLEFIDWEKLIDKNGISTASKSKDASSHITKIEPSTSATAALIKSALHTNPSSASSSSSGSNSNMDKNLLLVLMKDIELYTLLKDYYLQRQKNSYFFLDDSFQPLFTNILNFIRKSHYSKAIEILNLGTLLLLKQTQAELKRLLIFLYLTANSSFAPRLCNEKTNNSILLNHFSSCLIKTKLIGYEESRLLLNFMLNNFDYLFKLNPQIEESISKRRVLMQKYGQEEALIEKTFCKRLTNKEYSNSSKEQTTKALVDLINHIIDDPQISLKQKKLKLKALKRIHPEIYEEHFADCI